MKKMIVALAAVAILMTSGLAMAQGWGPPGRGMGFGPCGAGKGPGGFGPGLNLSAEQTQKMNTLREGFLKETMPLRNELMTKKLELRTLWSQANPEQEKIMAKQREINALRAQLQEKSTKHRLEMRGILTPEQRAQGIGFGYGPGPGRGMRGGFGPGGGWGKNFGDCPRW